MLAHITRLFFAIGCQSGDETIAIWKHIEDRDAYMLQMACCWGFFWIFEICWIHHSFTARPWVHLTVMGVAIDSHAHPSILQMHPLEDWACFSRFFPSPTLASLLHIFGHRSLSLPQSWLLFQHGVLLLPTWLPGLKSPQAPCRIKSNAVLSLFWLELWQTKLPHCMLEPATPTISDFTAREMPQVSTRAHGRGHWNPRLCGRRGGCTPFEHPINRGHPPLNFPRTNYLG